MNNLSNILVAVKVDHVFDVVLLDGRINKWYVMKKQSEIEDEAESLFEIVVTN